MANGKHSRTGALIHAAAVYERNPAGDLDPGEWVRLVIPEDLVRIVTDGEGRESVELHMYAMAALISERKTIDGARRAINLCRPPQCTDRCEECE